MLQVRGTQQPGPITELCRWLCRPVKARTKAGRRRRRRRAGANTHTGTPTHARNDAHGFKYTSPLLKKEGGP